MSAKVIRVIGFANGVPCPHAGLYVQTFDFDAHDGRGLGIFTPDKVDALKFPDGQAAFLFWQTQSKVKPTRPDGRPNRPLTAATVDIEDA